MSKETYSINCGGCVSLFIGLVFLWALFGSLPTFWGKLEIDFFWPAIRLDNVTYVGK